MSWYKKRFPGFIQSCRSVSSQPEQTGGRWWSWFVWGDGAWSLRLWTEGSCWWKGGRRLSFQPSSICGLHDKVETQHPTFDQTHVYVSWWSSCETADRWTSSGCGGFWPLGTTACKCSSVSVDDKTNLLQGSSVGESWTHGPSNDNPSWRLNTDKLCFHRKFVYFSLVCLSTWPLESQQNCVSPLSWKWKFYRFI